jgi:hypothetical protein
MVATERLPEAAGFSAALARLGSNARATQKEMAARDMRRPLFLL